jgi:hypothetical protein
MSTRLNLHAMVLVVPLAGVIGACWADCFRV